MLRKALRTVAVVVLVTLMPFRADAGIETPAREAILMDHHTGAVLFAKEPDRRMPPASMSKIMTAFMVFEQLQEGRLSLDDTFMVSEKAWRKGGSKMFVEVGAEVRIEDLLRGVIVQSGNDASIVLAEGLGGTEDAFGRMMTERAQELGAVNSTFTNATGWPDPDHRTTVRDLAIIARELIQRFPEYYHYYSEREFTWQDIRQYNRNPLLRRNMDVDGLKTGHTSEAGYGLTASAERDGRRLIAVVTGLDTPDLRAQEAARLLEWGFREFDSVEIFAEDDVVEEVPVWLGEEAYVPLLIREPLHVLLRRNARDALKVSVTYDSPVPAPIEAGQVLGTLRVEAPDLETIEVPLEAGAAIDQLGPIGRLVSGLEFLVFGAP